MLFFVYPLKAQSDDPKNFLPLNLSIQLSAGICQSDILPPAVSNIDSASYFLQKGLDGKTRLADVLESLKNFEKAHYYDASNKVIINELAIAYIDLRKFTHAKETYKKLVDLVMHLQQLTSN